MSYAPIIMNYIRTYYTKVFHYYNLSKRDKNMIIAIASCLGSEAFLPLDCEIRLNGNLLCMKVF